MIGGNVPAYKFICKLHKALVEVTRISRKPWKQLTSEEQLALSLCPQRNGLGPHAHAMHRNASGPTAQVKEILDNGAMKRKVERYKDAEKLYKDRADKDRIKQ